jgi:hypothetical protein
MSLTDRFDNSQPEFVESKPNCNVQLCRKRLPSATARQQPNDRRDRRRGPVQQQQNRVVLDANSIPVPVTGR